MAQLTHATRSRAPGVAAGGAHATRARRVSAAWIPGHLSALIGLDCLAIWLSLTFAAYGRFGAAAFEVEVDGMAYGLVTVVIAVGWLLALAANQAYEPRLLGTGPEEYKRVLRATFVTFGVVALVCYAGQVELARGFVAGALPLGVVTLLTGRLVARRALVRQRRRGEAQHRVLAVGTVDSVAHLGAQLRREPHAGYSVVGAYLLDRNTLAEAGDGLVLAAAHDDLLATVRAARADTVAVTAVDQVTSQRLREIAWQLEGTGVDLIVAPSLTDIAGPRIAVRPVGGLPLLHVDEPTFHGAPRIIKAAMDRVGAFAGLLLLSPLLLVVGAAIRLTSPGPALFRQRRTGADGKEFRVFKFRTMYRDAEARLAELQDRNEREGLLFKIKDDPRITPIGRFLRRTSVDELPQLINVLRGEMSLVGPRPLPVDDKEFQGHVRRRLLVRPGITGLLQVSGRSDLSWEDAVRLDLYYVENWSISLDLLILLRTITAVFRGSGAY